MSQCSRCGADIPKFKYSIGETRLEGDMEVNKKLVYVECPKCKFTETFWLIHEKSLNANP